jgi:hypothetical protein
MTPTLTAAAVLCILWREWTAAAIAGAGAAVGAITLFRRWREARKP